MADEDSPTSKKNLLKEWLNFAHQKLTPIAYYVCLLLVTITMALIFCTRTLQTTFFDTKFCKREKTKKFCPSLVGYGAVFRIFLAHALFQFVLAIVTSEYWLFGNWREKVHANAWSVKLTLLSVLVFGSLWIPSGSFFDKFLTYVGFLFSFFTILALMFLILDIVEYLLDHWIPDLESLTREPWTNPRFVFYLSIISILYLFSALFYIYCFFLFTNKTTCRLNLIFISYVLTHSLILSLLSPLLQFKNIHSSKATPKTLSCVLYVSFITWLAMCASTQVECNPYVQDAKHPGIDSDAIINVIIGLVVACHVINSPARALARFGEFFEVKWKNMEMKPRQQCPQRQDEEKDYSYTIFHILLFLLSLYFMSSTTSWHEATIVAGHVTYVTSRGAKLVLISATILCLWAFTWELVKPVLLILKNWIQHLIFEKEVESTSEKVDNFEEIDEQVCRSVTKLHGTMTESIHETIDDTLNESNVKANLQDTSLEKDDDLKDRSIFMEQRKDSPLNEKEEEIIRLQEKVLRLQGKICKLQEKVSTLQGVSL